MELTSSHRQALWSNRVGLFKGGLWLLAVDLVNLSLPLIIKVIIDRLHGDPLPVWIPSYWSRLETVPFIASMCLLFLGLAAFAAYGRYWWRAFIVWSTFPIFHGFRRSFFRHIQGLDRDFFKEHKTGDLISALTEDSENMRMTVSMGTLAIVDTVLNFILFPAVLFYLDPIMAIYVVPFLLLSSVFMIFYTDRFSKHYERLQDLIGDLTGRSFEIASGARIIKAFRKEKEAHHDFLEWSMRQRDAAQKVARYDSAFSPMLTFGLGLAITFVLLYGGLRVLDGHLALSSFVAFQLYLTQLDWPMMAMGWFIALYRRSKASKARVQRFVAHQSSLKRISLDEIERKPRHPQSLYELQDVSYRYPSRKESILTNISINIASGRWVGLSGPVGCGKTTFLELLSRQRDPEQGEVFYRGQSLRCFDPDELTKEVIYVPQESYLFSRSIRDNLSLGNQQKISDSYLWQLIGELGFQNEELESRGGLWTRLGERGANFSGGQKQRLALGRAILRDRKVYLFDDLFSHVDAETEFRLFQILKKRLGPNTSVLMVSQRLETLLMCHEVVVFANGRIEFQGVPHDGVKESAFLSRLDELQRKRAL